MLIADYIAISVLIVLTLWAGAERFLRGRHRGMAETDR
jgi:hypothetical protein